MDVGSLGWWLTTGLGLVGAILTWLGARARTESRRRRRERRANVAMADWIYETQMRAAQHRAKWLPPLPKEIDADLELDKDTSADLGALIAKNLKPRGEE